MDSKKGSPECFVARKGLSSRKLFSFQEILILCS